jgi:diguanylate cyclase (GGDEF)-like protein
MIPTSQAKATDLDALTQALSRAAIDPTIQTALEQAGAQGGTFSLMMVDLDHFKSINDAFGHPRGDTALIEMVKLIKSIIRDQDEVFRYGGDEFLLYLPGSNKLQAASIAERIQKTLRTTYLKGDPPIKLSVSIGLATYPEDAQTASGLVDVIDRRLYQGKHRGRGTLVVNDEISTHENSVQIVSPDRLVERDNAQETVLSFLQQMSMDTNSILHMQGARGSGRTRMLAECEKLARMQGYAVWKVTGTPALRVRHNGALSVLLNSSQWLPFLRELDALPSRLAAWAKENNLRGLLLMLDNIEEIDQASLNATFSLVSACHNIPLGVVYSGLIPYQSGAANPPQFTLNLTPISPQGVQIWLRYSLHWEAPDSLITWLHQKTDGLPSEITYHLEWLIEHGILRTEPHGWSLARLKNVSIPKSLLDRPGSTPTNLPVRLPDFFGRVDDIWALRGLLQHNHLVTVVGPDGIGKSRLNLQVAAESPQSFPDGVFQISLSEISSSYDFVFQLLGVMYIRLPATDDLVDGLITALSHKQILLLLDGFDLPVETANRILQIIEQLLSACHGLRMLVSAVHPLGTPLETVFSLKGLDIPPENHTEGQPNSAAVELFLRAAGRQAVYLPSTEDMPWIIRICRQLEGMPLGIELASAWISSYTCEQISAELEQNLGFLTGSSNNGLNRSMFAVIESFWKNFSAVERNTLSALAYFRSSFDQDAADQIAGASPFFLDSLAAKNILRVVQPRRYAIHHVLASYALQQLGDPATLEDRFAQFYLKFIQKSTAQLKSGNHSGAGLEEDLPNYRRAWELATTQGRIDLLLDSIDGFFLILSTLGRFKEGLELSEMAREASGGFAHPKDAAARQLIIKACIKCGEMFYHLGQYDREQDLLRQALDWVNDSDVAYDRADLLRETATLYNALGQYSEALELLNHSLEIASQLGLPDLLFLLRNRAGVAAYHQRNFHLSRQYFEAALEAAQQTNNPNNIAICLNNLGSVAIDLLDYSHARVLLLASLAKCSPVSMITLRGSVLESLGTLETQCGNPQEAGGYFTQGLRLIQDIDAVPLVLGLLINVALLWKSQNLTARAASLAKMVFNHPSAQHDVHKKAADLLDELGRLSSQQVTASKKEIVSQWQPDQLRRVIADVLELIENSK